MDGRIASLSSGPDRTKEANLTMPLSRDYESFLARKRGGAEDGRRRWQVSGWQRDRTTDDR